MLRLQLWKGCSKMCTFGFRSSTVSHPTFYTEKAISHVEKEAVVISNKDSVRINANSLQHNPLSNKMTAEALAPITSSSVISSQGGATITRPVESHTVWSPAITDTSISGKRIIPHPTPMDFQGSDLESVSPSPSSTYVEEIGMETHTRDTLSFDEVPGPTVLKYIAQIWSYVPVVGTQVTATALIFALSAGNKLQWSRNIRPFDRMFNRYGPVIRLQGPFGGNIVLLNRPEHMEVVYKQEGKFPIRSNLDCIEHYRKEHRRYPSAGPFLTCGPEWEKLRHKIDNPFEKSAQFLHDKMEFACEELICRIHRIRNRQEEVPDDFYLELNKWSAETLCGILFSKRYGFLDPHGIGFNSEQARLLEAIQGATDGIKSCETGLQLWRFYETSSWKSLVNNCDIIDAICSKHIRIAQNNLRIKKDKLEGSGEETISHGYSLDLPFIETLMLKEGMHADDILTVLLDMLLIGVNATASAMGFMLYHLSKSQRAQRILYEELVKVMPSRTTRLTADKLQECKYLKACVMESLRLKPPIPVLTRILPNDIVLHSYSIPKGTFVLMANQIACLREENFEDAHKFLPERWLKEDNKDIHPFATIPFGYGPRNCLGKSTAERQMWLLTAKLVRNFKIEYDYGDIKATSKLFAEPNRDLKFRFVDRI